jgi:hypothetical protein
MPELPELSPALVETYKRLLNADRLPPGTVGLDQLRELTLAVAHIDDQDRYTSAEPRHAATMLIDRIQLHMQALSDYTRSLPEFLRQIHVNYEAYQSASASAITYLMGRDEINSRIAEQHSMASFEVLSAQPGPRSAADLARSQHRDLAALRRGLKMRTVYHGSVRRAAAVGTWARAIANEGGEVRTLDRPFLRAIVFDRRVAFIPVYPEDGSAPSPLEAVMVRHELMANYVAAVHDSIWERAQPWMGGQAAEERQVVTTDVQREILRDLAQGRDQSQAGARLGRSKRWVNDQMRALREELGMDSLNQVIYWWATSPDHAIVD